MKYVRFIWNNSVAIVKQYYLLILLFLILESASNYTLIYVQRILIDDVFTDKRYELMPAVIGVFAGAGIVYALMFTMTSRYLVRNEFAISHSLLRRMLGHTEQVPVERFQNERTGKYVYTFTQDLFNTASFLGWQIPRGIQELLNLIILMTIIGFSSPQLLLMVVIMCIIYVGIGYYFSPRVKEAAKRVAERRTTLLIQIEEGVASTREVVAYHRLKWEMGLYNKLFGQYFEQVMEEGRLINRQLRYADPLRWGMGLLVLGYGGNQLLHGHMSIGTFVILFQFTNQLSDAFFNQFQFVMGVSGQLAYVDRVQAIIGLEHHKPGSKKLKGPVQSIRFENVAFRYAADLPKVIRGFTADLPAGCKIAFVGTSGGGKSTIAQLLIRFYDPTEGMLLVNGIPVNELNRERWADTIAIVFQDPYMFPDTIRENLLLGRNVNDEELEEACRIAQIHDFILSLPEGYDTNIGERGIKLSGGQRQRIAIARAVLGEPDVLVLDEATSALDLETERQLLQALDERRFGRTTIMIAHRLSTIENADIIFVMDQGALAETGTHKELLADGVVYPHLLRAERAS